MAYKIAPFAMILSDLQSYSAIASFLKQDFWYIFAAVDNISTD